MRSAFVNSNLWVREATSEWITVHPRHEFVDPTVRIATDRGNLSPHREYMQWMTGTSLFGQLAHDLWAGMNVTCQDAACWVDVVGYDHYLASTIMSRAGSQQSSVPREMVGLIVCGYSNAEGKQIDEFLDKRIGGLLHSKCEAKSYTMAGAPDLSKAIDTKNLYVKPTYDETNYTITKPLADHSLPLRQTVVDKWKSSGVPQSLQDTFDKEVVVHNMIHNKAGKPWTDSLKRAAVELPAGHDAIEAKPEQDDPKTVQDIQKLHDSLCEKTFDDLYKIYSSADGNSYLLALDDVVILKSKQLACITGEYLVGPLYADAVKNGSELFDWQMSTDDYVASFSTDPALKTVFPAEPKPLHEFLYYLEQAGNIGAVIECHTCKRKSKPTSSGAGTRLSEYEVAPSDTCGFRVKANKTDKMQLFNAVSPAGIASSKYLDFVMRLKFVKDLKNIQPQRPALHLKHSLRMRKGMILKLV